ncbi:UDP-N-acetylglucosamine transferase subunit ALG13 homolog [Mizuhopecten yessoensis]|uniref:UDP-N-acetylglucosamine transferase subunit ALG13 homolog n=1 Tax=Mizuhopecten yessoensis TaxID=6573 RepID=UPI000B45F889|nr:UDP-N-acetylglucosamine transferase subunit ALG13 homolog [Mizuhopecten yessoensis]
MAYDSSAGNYMQKQKDKNVFVTVGTTAFDGLINVFAAEETIQVLEEKGYTSVILQTGRGISEPLSGQVGKVTVQHYQYKPNIQEDISSADLVISHAGAGSCLETLGAGKPLLVVINSELMGNHQLELAKQLHKDGHIYYCDCGSLLQTLREINLDNLKPFKKGDPSKFAAFLDTKMGFS